MYDRLFRQFIGDVSKIPIENILTNIDEKWLYVNVLKKLFDEEKAVIKAAGGLDELLNRLKTY